MLGYDFEENKYDKKFILNNFLHIVLDDFPKITPDTVQQEIIHASYNLDINKIDNWKIKNSDFIEKVFNYE